MSKEISTTALKIALSQSTPPLLIEVLSVASYERSTCPAPSTSRSTGSWSARGRRSRTSTQSSSSTAPGRPAPTPTPRPGSSKSSATRTYGSTPEARPRGARPGSRSRAHALQPEQSRRAGVGNRPRRRAVLSAPGRTNDPDHEALATARARLSLSARRARFTTREFWLQDGIEGERDAEHRCTQQRPGGTRSSGAGRRLLLGNGRHVCARYRASSKRRSGTPAGPRRHRVTPR